MEAQRIPLKQIVANHDFNVRATTEGEKNATSDTTIETLAEDIRKHGQINPLIVRANAKGSYDLLAGFRRYMALTKLGETSAFVQVFSGSDEDAYFLNLTENTARADLTPFEIGARCYFIRKESVKWTTDGKEFSANKISGRIGGLSKAYITQLLRAFDILGPVLLERWKAENFKKTKDNVRYMTTDRINRLTQEHDHDKQLDMKVFDGLSWNDIKSGKTIDKDAKGDAEEGEGATKDDGPKRLTAKVIEETISFVKESDDIDADTTKLAVKALRYVLGLERSFLGYNPEKEAEKRAEEAVAIKEQEKAEKMAAKEAAKEAKANGKGAKATQAEA